MITRIICAFPGTGKTHLVANFPGDELVVDCDSSSFSRTSLLDGQIIRNPNFPDNYVNHIAGNVGVASLILASSHPEVKTGLIEAGLDITVAYPQRELREEYLDRYARRGSSTSFIEFMDKFWDTMISRDEAQANCEKIVLTSGQYLSDVV